MKKTPSLSLSLTSVGADGCLSTPYPLEPLRADPNQKQSPLPCPSGKVYMSALFFVISFFSQSSSMSPQSRLLFPSFCTNDPSFQMILYQNPWSSFSLKPDSRSKSVHTSVQIIIFLSDLFKYMQVASPIYSRNFIKLPSTLESNKQIISLRILKSGDISFCSSITISVNTSNMIVFISISNSASISYKFWSFITT